MKGEARIAGAGSTEDVPACFSFGIVFFINAAIWRKTTMEFFNQAITVLQTLVVAIGAGLGVWGVVNLMEGYGNDNPGAKSQGMKQLMSGGGVILIGTQLIPLLSGLFGLLAYDLHAIIIKNVDGECISNAENVDLRYISWL